MNFQFLFKNTDMKEKMAKKNVFLDLDNTLISAEYIKGFPFEKKGMREKAIQFALHDMDGYYIVFERPGVQPFLDWLFENYIVSVWTAASKDYALFIIKQVLLTKLNRKLDYILCSYQCDISHKKYNGDNKNLKLIYDVFELPGYDKDNTIIIDDLNEVYECQPKNCINIKAFEILDNGSEKDKELEKVKEKIKAIFKEKKN